MFRLQNPLKAYAWGSRSAIAELQGRPTPSDGPEAELWMGAHPSAPSSIRLDGVDSALDAVIAAGPGAILGGDSERAFGPRLPFLLKVLAAASPLSLQAHPSLAQAVAGFAREEALGLALGAPERSYKDASHKPEVLCALTPFWALSGFRAADAAARLLAATGAPEVEPFVAQLAGSGAEEARLRAVFLGLFAHDDKAGLAAAVARGVPALEAAGYADEARWTTRLAEAYPGDVGVVVALLLNLVRLEPGQALFLDAGNLHAYLEGTGIELMASSDNVLRGGLTIKHVDVAGLAEVLSFHAGGVPRATRRASPEGAVEYVTSAREFRLSRLELGASEARELAASAGPEILLVTRGSARVSRGGASLTLGRGESALLPYGAEPVRIAADAARATVFRATTALPPSR